MPSLCRGPGAVCQGQGLAAHSRPRASAGSGSPRTQNPPHPPEWEAEDSATWPRPSGHLCPTSGHKAGHPSSMLWWISRGVNPPPPLCWGHCPIPGRPSRPRDGADQPGIATEPGLWLAVDHSVLGIVPSDGVGALSLSFGRWSRRSCSASRPRNGRRWASRATSTRASASAWPSRRASSREEATRWCGKSGHCGVEAARRTTVPTQAHLAARRCRVVAPPPLRPPRPRKCCRP